jgi:hypothetical protein
MNNSSNLLISGSGIENSVISKTWKYAIAGAIFCVVFCLLFYICFSHLSDLFAARGDKDAADFFDMFAKGMIPLGILCFLFDLYLGQLLSKRIKAIEIKVYEDKIAGVAVGKDFNIFKMIFMCMGWANAKLINFDLAINQIKSVDIMGDNAIVINAQYMCFVSNNSEIQTTINNQIQRYEASPERIKEREEREKEKIERERKKMDMDIFFEVRSITSVKNCVESGIDANAKNGLGQTALHILAKTSLQPDIEIARYLISQGADVNALDGNGCTPLLWAKTMAEQSNNFEFVKYLVSQGAEVRDGFKERFRRSY